jgi:hypothetical protein
MVSIRAAQALTAPIDWKIVPPEWSFPDFVYEFS